MEYIEKIITSYIESCIENMIQYINNLKEEVGHN